MSIRAFWAACSNYGNVTVRGVGEGAETIQTIAAPLDIP